MVEDAWEEEEDVTPTTAANVAKLEAQTASVLPHPLDDRPLSPVSTTSSASEPPLVEQVKMNGGSSGFNFNPSTPAKTTREISDDLKMESRHPPRLTPLPVARE